MTYKAKLVIAISFLISTSAHGFKIKNLDEINRALNTKSWASLATKKRVKVAILDKGFYGYEKAIGKTLPKETYYFAGPVENPPDLKVEHGLAMAQIVTAIAKSPELYLYNAFGYSNFKASVEDLIAKKVDLVLYSDVWEIGGNRDGKGFINAVVDKALDEGIVWINAAGNFETSSYLAKIQTLDQEWVELPDQNHSLKIQCQETQSEVCKVKIVLNWNDFKDDPSLGTEKDLDLALTDDFLNILQTSALKQTADPEEKRPGYSSYPRETITAELEPGTYFIRVKDRSKNFDKDDELLITVDGDGISVPSHTKGQSVLNPADNPRVVTVGGLDSERSSTNTELNKPDLLTISSVKIAGGEFRGSSNSAALVAGAIALVKSRAPNRSIESIIEKASLPGWNERQRGLPLYWLGFGPPTRQCFQAATLRENIPQQITDVINVGGVVVETTAGLRIMTPYDPLLLDSNLHRYQPNDLILTTPEKYEVAPRNAPYLQNGWVEVFQTPQEAGLCQLPIQPQGKIFRLPNATN